MTQPDVTQCDRPYELAIQHLRSVGLRPTKQRLALARLLFDGTEKHVTAESLRKEVKSCGHCISIATIYNTLHQFTAAGLLRELVVEANKSYFDTRVENHCHFYCEASGQLIDIPQCGSTLVSLPSLPEGRSVGRVDVIIRLCPDD